MKKEFKNSLYNLPYATKIVILSIFPMTFLLKIAQFLFLPAKFFYDSNHIMDLMNRGSLSYDFGDSYGATALLFRSINFLNFHSLIEWGIAIAFIFDIYLIFSFVSKSITSTRQVITIICSVALLNIFVFNLSKDIIQFTIFMLISFCVQSKIKNTKMKIAFISILFLAESLLFRSYYILTCVIFIVLTIFVPFILEKLEKRDNATKAVLLLFISFVTLVLFLALCKRFLPDEYSKLVGIRNRTNMSRSENSDAQTMIVNLINDNGNVFLCAINFFINAFRILFPFELLFKGVYYFPFCVFQFLITWELIHCIIKFKSLDSKTKLAFYVMLAYFLVAFFFEPDFGSFVRHEAATFPVLFMLLTYNSITERSLE